MAYWLFKSEPSTFSIDDLAKSPKKTTFWDGVRNYQARNLLRDDIRKGDGVLFYHSSCAKPAVVGTAVVSKSGYPDHTAWDPGSEHPDPKSTEDEPIWYMVDIRFEQKFDTPVTLEELRGMKGLEEMLLLRRGQRLSVQPVTAKEWTTILKKAGAKKK
ncbi:MAG: EVE domain-containing protein [Planctomycetota bacterium]